MSYIKYIQNEDHYNFFADKKLIVIIGRNNKVL